MFQKNSIWLGQKQSKFNAKESYLNGFTDIDSMLNILTQGKAQGHTTLGFSHAVNVGKSAKGNLGLTMNVGTYKYTAKA